MESPSYLEKNRKRRPKVRKGHNHMLGKSHPHKAKTDYKRKPKSNRYEYED